MPAERAGRGRCGKALFARVISELFQDAAGANPDLPGRVGWVKGAFAAAPQIERISAAMGPVIPQT
jgi:hypothetical protein